MKFSELNFEIVKTYLLVDEEEQLEVEIYISAAKSYVKKYTQCTEEELDQDEYVIMPTLMLISSFYENKSVEMDGKINAIYSNLLNLGKVHSL